MDKKIIGCTEKVVVYGPTKKKTVTARIDTGAAKNSIDTVLAAELNLGPVIKTSNIRSALGISTRPIVEAVIEVAGKKIKSEFTLANRGHMNYRVLIGRNLLRHGFLIDPSKR
ncbi:RimK/LysX family protein [Candidatus Woesearchaeota archaeon]|nr:RimK/LysX family protein [Candidatus Woesearchaeota archaeon]MBW3021735.1 RimK/LysX family protein [Candidatus Woesearchaeota archaeon]